MRFASPRLLLILLLSAALAGCATMRPEECMVADWYLIGEMDAREGRTPSHLASRARDCAEAGYPADEASGYQGWEHGLTHFCTRAGGYRFAMEGQRYQSICPAMLEAEFLTGYDLGRQIHTADGELDRLRRQLDDLDIRIRDGLEDRSLDREQLEQLRQEQRRLQRQFRLAELERAELMGRAAGYGLR